MSSRRVFVRVSLHNFLRWLVFPLAAAVAFCSLALTQSSPQQGHEQLIDPQIQAALSEISTGQIQMDIEKLVSFQTRSTLSAQDAASVAQGHGIGAAREWIKSQFELFSRNCAGCLDVESDSFTQSVGPRVPAAVEITNVYAVLKGTNAEDAKRIVLVTGHYDSRNSDDLDKTGVAPGANDDASGTAVSLECARVLSRLRFPATVIFLTVAGEEQGLDGSKHFAELAKSQGWNIEAVLNNDIVGGDKSPGQDPSIARIFSEGIPDNVTEAQMHALRVFGGENDSPSRELARYIAQAARTYKTTVVPLVEFRPDRLGRGGDHSSFNREGYAAVRLTEFRENHDHQHQNVRAESGIEYGDLPKFVDFDYVANVARLNAASLASLASAPEPPQSPKLAMDQSNNSTLSWQGSHDGHTTSYDVLWRATAAPDWEGSQHVTTGTTVTIPISKDNVIFGIQAVDAAGHRGLPVVPVPAR